MIDTSELLFTLSIYKELKNNNAGRSAHWSSAHKSKREWVNALKEADVMTETGVHFTLSDFHADILSGQPLAQKVGIAARRVLGKRQRFFDADSILRGNFKECLDSVVDFGILTDDSTKHVTWCVGLQDDSRKDEGPFTELIFYGSK